MASEQQNAAQQGLSEHEPLLGRPGDASQPADKPLYRNLFIGTGVIAQVGILILAGIIWGSVLSTKIMLFTAHPLLNSAGLLLTTEAILLLQPTHTASQKRRGAITHSILNGLGVISLLSGLVVIYYNKASHNGAHFQSPHAILGLITYILFASQALVGALAFYTPGVFGSVDRAKSLYKYHRGLGYAILLVSLATVVAATQTTWNQSMGHIRLWAVVVAGVILLVGLLPRVRKHKLGL